MRGNDYRFRYNINLKRTSNFPDEALFWVILLQTQWKFPLTLFLIFEHAYLSNIHTHFTLKFSAKIAHFKARLVEKP